MTRRSRHAALRLGAGESVGQTFLNGPAGAAAPELIERIGDSGEQIGRIGRADLLRLPVAAERIADRLEGCSADPLADLLGKEFGKLCARGTDVDRVALALDEAHAIDVEAGHGVFLSALGQPGWPWVGVHVALRRPAHLRQARAA